MALPPVRWRCPFDMALAGGRKARGLDRKRTATLPRMFVHQILRRVAGASPRQDLHDVKRGLSPIVGRSASSGKQSHFITRLYFLIPHRHYASLNSHQDTTSLQSRDPRREFKTVMK